MVTSWLGHGCNRLELIVKIQVMVTSWLCHGCNRLELIVKMQVMVTSWLLHGLVAHAAFLNFDRL